MATKNPDAAPPTTKVQTPVAKANRTPSVLQLSKTQQRTTLMFAKQLLIDGEEFRSNTFLANKHGDIRLPLVTRLSNAPNGWAFLKKMQLDQPELSPSTLLEQFFIPTKQDAACMPDERNLFLIRTLEALREAIASNAPLENREKAEALLAKVTIPKVENPPMVYPDEDFTLKLIDYGNGPYRGWIIPRKLMLAFEQAEQLRTDTPPKPPQKG